MSVRILLVDDDPSALDSTRKILELSKFEVVTAGDGQAALDLLRPTLGTQPAAHFDLVLSDVRMPRLGGLEFLRAVSLCGDQVPVILMTAFGRVEDAVWAMKLGAVDFLTKPFKRQALLSAIDGALKRRSNRSTQKDRNLLGQSPSIRSIREMIKQVAPTAATVLLTGESGTGKEMVARAIHEQSTRSKSPMIALNCAAVPENLIESELFGFDKGAFTGANASKSGLFEAASGGTLLLDEIGDMPFHLQAKLLRVLQEGEVRRVGSTMSRKVDVRLIAATHQNLHERIATNQFRQDLLYRLAVVQIQVPALRERLEDLPDLALAVLSQAAERHSKSVTGISSEAMDLLLAHAWPGNVRELSNVIERAAIFAQSDVLQVSDLPEHLASNVPMNTHTSSSSISVPLGTSLKDVEDLLIRKTLEATSGDKNMTAKLLGINSRTIYRKLAQDGGESK
jgi:two-component system response regulator HydG